jgi:peptidoglycan/LPS O-acetylase OafA/YrhL
MKLPGRGAPIDYLMVLRGAAVIGVFLGHVAGIGALCIGAIASRGPWGYVPDHEPLETWRTVVEILTPLLGGNFVTLFFVQSGYLMGKVFFDGRYDATSQKGAFYWARYLRLAPALYVNLLICALFFKYADNAPLMMIGDVLFINNFTGRGINLVTWSLSHEMQYYLVAPFVFLVCRNRPALLLVLIALTFWLGQMYAPFGAVFSFLLGFGVNLLPKPAASPTEKQIGLVIGLLVLHLGFNVLLFHRHHAAAFLLASAVSAVLVWLCERPSPEERQAPFLHGMMTMGFLTYGFYLWHYPILRTLAGPIEQWVQAVTSTPWLATPLFHAIELVLVFPLSLAAAYGSFVLIEARFRPSLYSSIERARWGAKPVQSPTIGDVTLDTTKGER